MGAMVYSDAGITIYLFFIEQPNVILTNDRDEKKNTCLNEASGQGVQL